MQVAKVSIPFKVFQEIKDLAPEMKLDRVVDVSHREQYKGDPAWDAITESITALYKAKNELEEKIRWKSQERSKK